MALQILDRQIERQLGSNDLGRLAIPAYEGGAQDLMAPDDFVETPGQGVDIQRACYAKRRGNVVDRAARLKLLEKPQALLRIRQHECACPAFLGQDGAFRRLSSLSSQAPHEKVELLRRQSRNAFRQVANAILCEFVAPARTNSCRLKPVPVCCVPYGPPPAAGG